VEMLGRATSASRTYHNGTQRVEVQITSASPMLQNMTALLPTPYAQAAGVKPETIAGRSVSDTGNDNRYITLVAARVIVKVDGNKDTPEPVLRTFVATIDFDAAANWRTEQRGKDEEDVANSWVRAVARVAHVVDGWRTGPAL
jgi:hypothetical protein